MSEVNVTRIEGVEDTRRLERNSFVIAVAASAVAALGSAAAWFGGFTNPWTILPILIFSLIGIYLIRNGRYITANWLIIFISIVVSAIEVLSRSGQGINRGAIGVAFISGYAMAAMPRHLRGRTLLLALLVGIGMVVLDFVGPAGREVAPQTPLRWVIVGISILIFSLFTIREFTHLDLRTKVAFGILGTGGIALATLAFFAINRAGVLVNALSDRLDTTVVLLAEEQLVNKVAGEARTADEFFESTASQIEQLTKVYLNLHEEEAIFGQGVYWNAAERLFQFEDGKYGNPADDASSVFVPSFVNLDEEVIEELNTSSYLDFYIPQALEENQSLLAVYYIEGNGVVRYYPNIELASLLPPDFDATTRPYYDISTPLFNRQKITRWTIPYVDAAGGGLVVTAAHPIYEGNEFLGVVAADVQLSTLTNQISAITFGDTGYAFMLDDAGRIISMPQAGYDLFGVTPADFAEEDFAAQTLLSKGGLELSSITRRMVAGGTGLNTYVSNDIEYYIGYTRIPSNGYSIAIVVPVSELQTAIEVTRQETRELTIDAIRTGTFILIGLLVFAIIFSLGLGQIIAQPVLRLTQTANKILEGELTAQADVSSQDETGTLAQAFNAMTARLRATFEGLEKNIEERTAELLQANERNERRARQFQSIAQVARTISSTFNLDNLLAQITNVISREFGFYHVGVFLLDTAGEYAILSAANSEGGQAMLARDHRLKVGEKGLVGFVSSTGRPRVALDTGADAVFFNNPDLPNTHSEIALPLRAGENVIGVLDVQSTEPNAFSQEDVNILSTLADQVSIAIQNARQNQQTQKALAESDALSRQFVQTGWKDFTTKQKLLGVRHTGAKSTLLYTNRGGNGSAPNLITGELKPRNRGATLSLPIKLRGEVIGSVDVRSPDNREWSRDEMDIVTAIIERAAIALENARLLSESQKRAAKERTIGEISAKISAQREIEDLLKIAAQELNRSMPGADIAIQFRKEETE